MNIKSRRILKKKYSLDNITTIDYTDYKAHKIYYFMYLII